MSPHRPPEEENPFLGILIGLTVVVVCLLLLAGLVLFLQG